MRSVKVITPLKRAAYPNNVIWFDTETTPERVSDVEERHVLEFGWGCYRRQLSPARWSRPDWRRFATAAQWWDWVESKMRNNTVLYIYAHNMGYDSTVVQTWSELPQRGWDLKAAVLDSPPFIAHWRSGRKSIRMLDTLNLWPIPLKRLGELVNLPKLERPGEWTGTREDDRYCKRDVEILMTTCLKWWEWLADHRLGGAAATRAAQAMVSFRYRFLSHTILIDNNLTALSLARDAYHGGRTEVFKVGVTAGPLYLLDVRSEYPTVMQRENYPTVLRGVYGGITLSDLHDLLARYAVVADVEVGTPEPCYPFSDSSPLLFPVGKFRTVLSSGELAYALERGHIKHVRRLALYDRAPIFREFVTDISALREVALKSGDKFRAWVLKYHLNSLYGKFGQRGRKSRRVATTEDLSAKVWDEVDGETGTRYRMRQLGGVIEQHWVEGESAYSHPAIAAHVTAYGRLLLWELIRLAGDGTVLYCDTDSVLVNQSGYERLRSRIGNGELGSLHLDKKVGECVIHAPKDYALDGVTRIKGVRKDATWTDANTVIQDKWLGIRSLLMRGDVSAPIVRREVKHLKRRYNKGVVLASGWVRPYRLPDEAGRWLSDATR